MQHLRFRSAALAAGLLAVGGCAILPPPRSASQLVDFPEMRQPDGRFRDCVPAEHPRALPAAGALVDSAALAARLSSLPPGTAVYSVLFTGEGEVERAARIPAAPGDLPADADAVVAEHLRRQAARGERWGVQLRVSGGGAPAVQVGRQEYCPALAVRRVELGWWVGVTGEEGKTTFTDGEMADWALHRSRLRVTAGGEVVDASLPGTSIHLLTAYRFEPALIDRIPVDTLVEF